MIIFHEGMPRSGKSYASMADHIIPALQKGRSVYARLDGLDYDRIAEAAAMPVETVRVQLFELSEEDVRNITTLSIEKDALIVIDELQNYWPQGRAQLAPEMVKWIAEHGHHGWDVLTMGQLLKDCHRTWVNRTNRKIQFVKKDVLGKPNEYKWTMYTGKPDGNGNVKFIEVTKGDAAYDPKYFGCYKSHSEGTENTDTYSDDRVVIWNNPIFKKWLPMFGVALFCAVAYIVYFFNGGGMVPKTPQKPASGPQPVSVVETVTTSGPGQETKTITRELIAKADPEPSKKSAQQYDDFDLGDYITKLSGEHKIRLGAVIRSSKGAKALIEWRDSSLRVVESFSVADLEALGWHVFLATNDRMAIVTRPGVKYIATAWPIEETTGKATRQQLDEIRAPVRQPAPPVGLPLPAAFDFSSPPISLNDKLPPPPKMKFALDGPGGFESKPVPHFHGAVEF